jgi:hypothetical protein
VSGFPPQSAVQEVVVPSGAVRSSSPESAGAVGVESNEFDIIFVIIVSLFIYYCYHYYDYTIIARVILTCNKNPNNPNL